jgi:hypothetical protein
MVPRGGFPMDPKRNPWLITRLFDLGFSHFIALSLIRMVYALLMVAGLVLLAVVIYYQFAIGDRAVAILLLLLAPIINLAYLLIIRLICETLIVVFTVAENLSELREAGQSAAVAARETT